MKKIFKLFAISLVFVLPIVSCTTDDESAKQAQTDKESLEIPGDEGTSNIQHNQLALYASGTTVNVGTLVSFTTVLNGEDVTNDVTYYVNGLQVGGSSITSAFNGTFRIQAKKEGYIDSPVVTVVYGGGGGNPNPDPTPTGNFILNGTGYNVTSHVLVFNGAFLDEGSTVPYTSWTAIVVNNAQNPTVGAAIDFKTPFTITNPNTNEGEIVLPNGANETYVGAEQILANALNFENVIGTGTIHYTANFNFNGTTNAFTSNITFGTNSLQINYNGAYAFLDNSEADARPAARSMNNLVKISTKKPTKYGLTK